MLPDVDLMARQHREDDDLTRLVAGEGDPAGPCATEMMNGIPAKARRIPPWSFITDIGTWGSFHNITWCSKKTQSPAPMLISATGTTSPST